jgi:hypothetical protein
MTGVLEIPSTVYCTVVSAENANLPVCQFKGSLKRGNTVRKGAAVA